jgi:hypothetical protein
MSAFHPILLQKSVILVANWLVFLNGPSPSALGDGTPDSDR